MSIVICAIINNETMFLGADCRAVNSKGINDNFKKIFKIGPQCFYGITGYAESGLWFLERVKAKTNLSTNELIKWADDDFKRHNFSLLTVMLAGKNEKGDFFIWQKNQDGDMNNPAIVPKGCTFAISANNNIPHFIDYFKTMLMEKQTVQQAISRTIIYASSIDRSISEKHEIIVLQ